LDHPISNVTGLAGFALIQYPSLVQGFVDRLATGIANLGLSANHPIAVPIQPIKTNAGRVYASSVALQLARQSDHSAVELAQRIISPSPNQPQVCLQASGWIHCPFSDGAIAGWLQDLSQIPPQLVTFPVESDPGESEGLPGNEHGGVLLSEQIIFKLQYAHARCCSLLRLADRDRLLQLVEPNPASSPRLWRIPTAIPWLTPCGQLRLVHPQEQSLIQQLLEFPGSLTGRDRYSLGQSSLGQTIPVTLVPWPPAARIVERQMQLLCERFEGFYRHCRIWGEVKQAQPELAIARLGLVVATQSVLKFCLQDLLNLDSPLEL
jgi:arginyl-tRNA synthetase